MQMERTLFGVSGSQMTNPATSSYIAPSRWALRRRAGRLAAGFGLLIAAAWVLGGLLHQDLLAGLLVLAMIVVGWFLLATIAQMAAPQRFFHPDQDSQRAHEEGVRRDLEEDNPDVMTSPWYSFARRIHRDD